MKVVALISGGKDSVYNMMKCIEYGHEIVCLANLHPTDTEIDDLDSFMYQTVGHQHIAVLAACLGLPLVRQATHGRSQVQSLHYTPNLDDEVEDLLLLLRRVKLQFPEVEAVASGAILSNYQRLRVENVCSRLGLMSLAYLWQRDQDELLQEMVDRQLNAIIVKVAAMGLGKRHLGQAIKDLLPVLQASPHVHTCGEGGEFETFVIDCPLFVRPMEISEGRAVMSEDNPIAPVGVWQFRCAVKDGEMPLVASCEAAPPLSSTSPSTGPQVPDMTFDSTTGPLLSEVNGILFMGGLCLSALSNSTAMALQEEVHYLLQYVKWCLAAIEGTMGDVFFVHIYCQQMQNFVSINTAYSMYFGNQPPARATLGIADIQDQVMMEIYARSPSSTQQHQPFESLHVQSISEWAPACIGPYSQAFRVGDTVFFAGIIGLIPETMQLPTDDLDGSQEISLVIRSLVRVAKVMGVQCSDAILLIIYVTDLALVDGCLACWNTAATPEWNGILRIVQVTALPRGCRVEVQMVTLPNAAKCPSLSLDAPVASSVQLLWANGIQGCNGLTLWQWALSVTEGVDADIAIQQTIQAILQSLRSSTCKPGILRWFHSLTCPLVPNIAAINKHFEDTDHPPPSITLLPSLKLGISNSMLDIHWVVECIGFAPT